MFIKIFWIWRSGDRSVFFANKVEPSKAGDAFWEKTNLTFPKGSAAVFSRFFFLGYLTISHVKGCTCLFKND